MLTNLGEDVETDKNFATKSFNSSIFAAKTAGSLARSILEIIAILFLSKLIYFFNDARSPPPIVLVNFAVKIKHNQLLVKPS